MLLFRATSRTARKCRLLFLLLVSYRQRILRVSKSSLPALLLLLTGISYSGFTHAEQAITLSSDSDVATAGFFQLQWKNDQYKGNWQLQESEDPDLHKSKIIYTGRDLARVISGKPDGDYYYRVVTDHKPGKQFSNIVKVTVAHHPLRNAFMFFTIGAVIFIAILFSIIKGNRKTIH